MRELQESLDNKQYPTAAIIEDQHFYSIVGIVAGAGIYNPALFNRENTEEDHNDYEPPKPPRRPNARIGRVVLEGSF